MLTIVRYWTVSFVEVVLQNSLKHRRHSPSTRGLFQTDGEICTACRVREGFSINHVGYDSTCSVRRVAFGFEENRYLGWNRDQVQTVSRPCSVGPMVVSMEN